MRKLRIIEHISLDGVIQAPAGQNEDGDYPYGGWTAPYRDPVTGKAVVEAHANPFDLLLGRRTYDIWSAFWQNAGRSPLADSLNAAIKYVATHRPDTLERGPVESLGPDIIADVQSLRATAGPDLILWGSWTLTSRLLQHGLADELCCSSIQSCWAREGAFFRAKLRRRRAGSYSPAPKPLLPAS